MTCSVRPSTFHCMARKPRGEFAGALYHVIARGYRRAPLFHDDADYTAYLDQLQRCRDGVTAACVCPHEQSCAPLV